MALEFRAMLVPMTAKHNFVSFASPLDILRLLTSLSGRPSAIKYCCEINTWCPFELTLSSDFLKIFRETLEIFDHNHGILANTKCQMPCRHRTDTSIFQAWIRGTLLYGIYSSHFSTSDFLMLLVWLPGPFRAHSGPIPGSFMSFRVCSKESYQWWYRVPRLQLPFVFGFGCQNVMFLFVTAHSRRNGCGGSGNERAVKKRLSRDFLSPGSKIFQSS